MIKTLTLAAALALSAGAALAAPPVCKDAKGKAVACPATPSGKQVCKDSKGRVVKCGAPGAKPAGDQPLGDALNALRAGPK
jgi:hypothetical protein